MLYSIIPILNIILGSEVINIKCLRFDKLVVEAYAGKARYTFFMQKDTGPFPISQFDTGTYLIIPVYIVMNFYYFLGGHFFDLSVLMGALTLRHLAALFAHTVNGCSDAYYVEWVSNSNKFINNVIFFNFENNLPVDFNGLLVFERIFEKN